MRQWRLVLGTAISVACLVLLLARVDLAAVGASVRAANASWLLVATPLFAASIWARAMRWRAIVAPIARLSRGDAAALVVIGYAANNLLPARTGEVVRAVLLQRGHGASAMAGLGTIVVERVFDGLVLALMLAGTLAVAGGTGLLRTLAAVAGAGFAGIALMLLLLAIAPRFAWAIIEASLRLLPRSLAARVRALVERFLDGLATLRDPRTSIFVIGASVLGWLLEAGACWAIGEAFALPLAPLLYLGICGAANLAIAAPSTSGGIGPYELLASAAAVAFGASTAAATAFAIALHAFVLVPVTIVGVLLLWQRHLGLGTLTTSRVPNATNEVRA